MWWGSIGVHVIRIGIHVIRIVRITRSSFNVSFVGFHDDLTTTGLITQYGSTVYIGMALEIESVHVLKRYLCLKNG